MTLHDLLFWWLLPSLITFLLVFSGLRNAESPETLAQQTLSDWAFITMMGVFYPLGIYFYLWCIGPKLLKILLKER